MPRIELKAGSNLSSIAKQYGTTVPELVKLNPHVSDPNFVNNGGTLNIPDSLQAPGTNQTAQSVGNERTLDGKIGPVRTLPDQEPAAQNSLVRFSSVINDAVRLAKEKRAKFTEEAYNETVPMGALPANSFASFLAADVNNANDFANPLIKTAQEAFKLDEDSLKKNRDAIRGIAEKVAENGGSAKAVKDILAMDDVENALIYATPLIKKKATGGGTGDGAKYSPEDLRTLRQAGLASNPDTSVKDFFLNTDPQFRADFTKNYAKGLNQSVNLINIGQSFDDWSNDQEIKKKNKSGADLSSQIESINFQ